jgi:hypothetical protein
MKTTSLLWQKIKERREPHFEGRKERKGRKGGKGWKQSGVKTVQGRKLFRMTTIIDGNIQGRKLPRDRNNKGSKESRIETVRNKKTIQGWKQSGTKLIRDGKNLGLKNNQG